MHLLDCKVAERIDVVAQLMRSRAARAPDWQTAHAGAEDNGCRSEPAAFDAFESAAAMAAAQSCANSRGPRRTKKSRSGCADAVPSHGVGSSTATRQSRRALHGGNGASGWGWVKNVSKPGSKRRFLFAGLNAMVSSSTPAQDEARSAGIQPAASASASILSAGEIQPRHLALPPKRRCSVSRMAL